MTRLPLSHLFLGTVKSQEIFKNCHPMLMTVFLGKLFDKTQKHVFLPRLDF